MAEARVPSWWVDLDPSSAQRLEDLFADVMAHLPVPKADLAEELSTSSVTLWRWAEGKTTPSPERMLEAVGAVRAHLESQLLRATVAEEALQQLRSLEEAEFGKKAYQDATERIRELLDGLDEES